MMRFWISTVIFLALAATVPLFYFMIADGALMPFGGIVMLLIFHLIEAPIFALLEVVHVAIYGPLLFLIAWICSGKICPPGTNRVLTQPLAIVVGVILSIGFAPVLRAGHGVYDGLNAYEFYPMMYRKIIEWSYRPSL